MTDVSGDSPSRKTCRSSINVIDATDASSSVPCKDTNDSNAPALFSNAPISSDIGVNGKTYKKLQLNQYHFLQHLAALHVADLHMCQ